MKTLFYHLTLSIALLCTTCPTILSKATPLQSINKPFSTILQENQFIVIDFWMDGCPPCKRLAPKIDQLADKFPNVLVLKVNIHQYSSVASQYNVRSVPNIVYIKNGQRVGGHVGGNVTLQTMVNNIHNHFGI